MMTKNSSDYQGGRESILILGPGGGGKTAGFGTIPGRKFCYIFDQHALTTLRYFHVDYEEFIAEHLDLDAVTLRADTRDKFSKKPEPTTYVEFEKHFESAIEKGFFNDYDVVGFDSLTTLQDIVMDRIMHLNNRFGKWPEMADYTATVNTLIKIVRTLTSLGKIVYVTGHIEYKQEEQSGKMQNVIALIGRLRYRLPLAFSDIWLAYADQDKDGKTHFNVRTQPDRYSPFLRCSLRNVEAVEDVTIRDWKRPEGEGIGRLLKRFGHLKAEKDK